MGTAFSALRSTIRGIRSVVSLLLDLSAEFNLALKRASKTPGLPNPNPIHSYWLTDPPFPELENTRSDELPKTADVAIIGSGITGAAIAWSLLHERRRRDVDIHNKVVVFEARQLCSGATARNGGHIKAVPYETFPRLSKMMSHERAAALTRFQIRHLECLTKLCRAEGIEMAEAREVETVDLFLDEKTFRERVKDVETLKDWIPEVEISTWEGPEAGERFGSNDTVKGALSYQAGAIWAYRFVVSIWKRLLDKFSHSLSIETNTPVDSISISLNGPPGLPYEVRTSRGVTHVRHVVHATNGFACHLVPGLVRKIVGARAHMSAQRPGQQFPRSEGNRSWSVVYGGGFDYATQRPPSSRDKSGDILLGGGFIRSLKQGVDQIGLYDDSTSPDPLTITHIAGLFPATFHPKWGAGAELKDVWTGILGFTGDLLPLVGQLDERLTGRKIGTWGHALSGKKQCGEWIAAGFSGEGMIWAWLCGSGLGIMIAGSEEEDLPELPGRPDGKLKEWFPNELLICPDRLRSADVSNLANQS